MAAADHVSDQSGPACLVRRTKASTVVAVEVFVEEQVVAPPRVALDPLRVAEARPSSVAVDQEYRHQALPDIGGDDIKRDADSRSGRVFDGQFMPKNSW
jgi:hypothetical protein